MPEGRRERTDATRNRHAILQATEDLLTRHRPEQISLEQVAALAGVAKGTVFHRFGSRTGLMTALMEERAKALQEAVLTGPPPLGPGAPAAERIRHFLTAIVDVVARNVGLRAALDHALATQRQPQPGQHDADSVYQVWHRHLSTLITEGRPDLDADLLAHLLLSPLHSGYIQRLLRDGAAPRLKSGLHTLADGVLTSPPVPPSDGPI
jgi:AcrR family transcriptional regulator